MRPECKDFATPLAISARGPKLPQMLTTSHPELQDSLIFYQ